MTCCCGRVSRPLSLTPSSNCWYCAELAQADPILQVVGQASPQHFHLHFLQAPYMELPQSQLALDPRVTKLHDSSTTTISLLDFLAGHLLAKRHHHRAFFQLRYGTAVLLVVRTTLRFARTASAILQPGLVEVVSHPCSYLASCLRKQDFALRTNTAVPLRLIEECARWKPVP